MSNERCPLCDNRLYPKKYGCGCKNHKCKNFWKLSGWVLQNSIWVYQDNGYDRNARWDRKHGYSPRKFELPERHVAAMLLMLKTDENLCFVIPEKYCQCNSEGMAE